MHSSSVFSGQTRQPSNCFLPTIPTASGRKCAVVKPRRATITCSSIDDDNIVSSSDSTSSPFVPDTLPLIGKDTDWRTFRARLVQQSSKHNNNDKESSSSSPSQSQQQLDTINYTTTTTTTNNNADPTSNIIYQQQQQPTTTPPPPRPSSSFLDTDDVWAHPLVLPEKGCLLLSHPIMFTSSQTYFFQSVILVWAHDDTGSAGLILNRPTQHRVGSISGAEILQPELSNCPIYLGGDVGKHTLHLLHGNAGFRDSIEVLPGVHLGGFEGAKAAVASGAQSPDDFRVLTRYCGWSPGQLEDEVRRGVWFPAAASKSVVLQQASLGRGGELWHAVMQLMGGEYSELSSAVSETYRSDIMDVSNTGEKKKSSSSSSSSSSRVEKDDSSKKKSAGNGEEDKCMGDGDGI